MPFGWWKYKLEINGTVSFYIPKMINGEVDAFPSFFCLVGLVPVVKIGRIVT